MTSDKDANTTAPDAVGRDRSPPFPFISLEKAVDRARQFEVQYKRSPGRIPNVLELWGFSSKSSGGLQTVGAMRQFGLMVDEGSNADRKVRLTELAFRILKEERPAKRSEALKEAALKSKAVSMMYAVWGTEPPPNSERRSELTLERNFTDDAANRFLRVYDDTIRFAGFATGDSILDKGTEGEDTVTEGDSPPPQSPSAQPPVKPPAGVKPMDAHVQDVLSLDQTQAVTIQYPANLSMERYEDVEAWLEIVKRKIRREIEAMEKASRVPTQNEKPDA